MGATINNESTKTEPPTQNDLPLPVSMEKQYSKNVSKDVFDNNTRLKISFTSMLKVQDNTGISFYIVSI